MDLFSALGTPTKALSDSRVIPAITPDLPTISDQEQRGVPRPNWFDQFPKAYEASVWVYACVWEIATNLSGVPLKIFRKLEDGSEEELNLRYILRPNPFMTMPDLIEATSTSLELQGNAYWEKVRGLKTDQNSDETITNLIWIMANHMEVVPDPKRMISAYKLKTGGGEKDTVMFKPQDIGHFKYHHPSNYYYGFTPVRAAMISIESDGFGRRLFRNMYKNQAVPGGVLTSEDPLDDDTLKRLKLQWKAAFSGVDKAFEPAVLEQGLTWQHVQLSPSDLGFIEFASLAREEILAVFGVPPILVGLDTTNYATAFAQRRTFWENTLIPKARKIASCIKAQIIEGYDLDEIEVRFDLSVVPELQKDWIEVSDTLLSLKQAGVMSLNEIRQIYTELIPIKEFPDVEGGDLVYTSANLLPVGEVPRMKSTTTIIQQRLQNLRRKIAERSTVGSKSAMVAGKLEKMLTTMFGAGTDVFWTEEESIDTMVKRMQQSGVYDKMIAAVEDYRD